MPDKSYTIQTSPFTDPTADGKVIQEHFGIATDGNSNISIAHMIAPPGWSEPFQTPQFDEYTFVIQGKKQFIVDGDTIILSAGQSIKITKNTKVQYSNPFSEPCHYLSICLPAFSMELVHRES